MHASTAIEAKISAYYTQKIHAHGDVPAGLDWKDAASQELRFAVLSDVFRLFPAAGPHLDVLDVGCGTGDLAAYLLKTFPGRPLRYRGIDVSSAMLERACSKFAGVRGVTFACSSLHHEAGLHDYVISSGIFNVNEGETADVWEAYIQQSIALHFAHARIGVATNMMTDAVDFRAPHLFYADPCAMLAMCRRQLSRHLALRHDYPLYEFSLFVGRNATVSSEVSRHEA